MSAIGLTRKMKDCKEFITVYTAMHGMSPTFDEIKDNMGLKSKSGVHRLLKSLEERGHVLLSPKWRRSIVLKNDVCPTCGHGG
jgi:repressor LexA